MILQGDCFLRAQGFGDVAAFFLCENNAAEVLVDGVIFVEAGKC